MTSSELLPGSHPDDVTGTPTRRSRRIWWIIGGIVLLVAIVAVARYRATHEVVPGRFGRNGPLSVGVTRVRSGDIPISINALGTVTPLATVTVHPQVTGLLVKIGFKEGQLIKAGELLAQIDPRPYQATLDQAQAQLQHDQALLDNARVDLQRYKTLLAQNSVSDQTYATQMATVTQDVATVAADRAAVDSAKLNLEFCRITSPVSGLVGLRQVDVGNLMQANSTEIVVVTQIQPMSVLFTVPEDSLTGILQRLRDGQKLTVDAFDRSQTNKIASGTLSNSDNEIDTTTGTLKLRAMFDNSKQELFPSQFVNVSLLLDTLHDAVVIPGAGLQQGSSGSYVYIVNPHNTVSMRTVKTGPSSGDLVSITQGLKVGETIVVDGADQLRDGAQITVPGDTTGASGARGPSDVNGQRAHRRGYGSSGGASSGTENGARHYRQHPQSSGGDNAPPPAPSSTSAQ